MRPAAQAAQRRQPYVVSAEAPAITWSDYARIAPGEYLAYCRAARVYRDPGFRRWVCLLRWEVLDGSSHKVIARLPMWFALGKDAEPHAGRRSLYWREWVRAAGASPTRADRLAPTVFRRRMARVSVRNTAGDAPYSVVAEILHYETGAHGESSVQPVT